MVPFIVYVYSLQVATEQNFHGTYNMPDIVPYSYTDTHTMKHPSHNHDCNNLHVV